MMKNEIEVGAYYLTNAGVLVHVLGGNADRHLPNAHWVVTILDNSPAIESANVPRNRTGDHYSVNLHGGLLTPVGGRQRVIDYDDPFSLKTRAYLTTVKPIRGEIEATPTAFSKGEGEVSEPYFRLNFYIPPVLSRSGINSLNVDFKVDAPGLLFTGVYPDEPKMKAILRSAMKSLLRQMVDDGSAYIDPDHFFGKMGGE